MTLKTENTQLKRENTRLAKAVARQEKGILDRQVIIDAAPDWEKSWGDVRAELSDVKRAKNDLVEAKAAAEKTVKDQANLLSQHRAMLKDIQRDIETACEIIYGAEFDPSNIERLMPMMSGGIEYVPEATLTEGPSSYVDPTQRLVRMVWRRTHWGLNPLVHHDHLYAHGKSS